MPRAGGGLDLAFRKSDTGYRESARQSPCHGYAAGHGGKSGLHRAGCQVTPGGREPKESAAESRPPKRVNGLRHALVRVKGCGKSAPRGPVTGSGMVNPTWSKAK